MQNQYKTVKHQGTGEIIEKRSRFIANVKPVSSEEEALLFLNELKQKYWDARHNVYAYIIKENNIMRYSDDGEPGGTAGMPVLDMLKKEELTDVIVVVTRYFGGILLGTGGLVHAYSKSAKEGILAAEIKNMILCQKLLLKCDYNLVGKLQYEIQGKENIFIGDAEYAEDVVISVFIPCENVDNFINNIIDKTNGNVEIEKAEVLYFEKQN